MTATGIHSEQLTPHRKLRILLVDERLECAKTLGRLLTLLGHDTRIARDGVEGVEAALEFRPDVVPLDIGLPEPDGYEVARRIREQSWGTGATIIALTAFGEEIDERRFREAGFDDHLAKPVNAEALIKLIGRPLSPPARELR
ncbi:Response regulator receiver domain-containing protein [Singulisphaera sp. GP187]|uniref:response regulator n=1 Tax=Singulisphaera sp. GP187 TaxID=1882752 RepID=UPI00092797D6|nr:response regulator [Singulisphaera sp. GP187]SIN88645.1 Response regulator receiver domain-containing protein [Singulisphaera sp. GP187]